MTFHQYISKGISGKNQGLKNGFNKLNKYLYNLLPSTYYLIGGGSGAAKTSLVNYILFNAIEDAKVQDKELIILYYAFEIGEMPMKAAFLSNYIYTKTGVEIPYEKICGLGENRLTEVEQDYVYEHIGYIDDLFTKIKFSFVPNNPTGVYKDVIETCEKHGAFEYEEYEREGVTKKRRSKFIPHKDNCQFLLVMDNINILREEKGMNKKGAIDKMSGYLVELRNLIGFTHIVIQQFNGSLTSVERQKFKGGEISPVQGDFKDSTKTYDDADIALGVVNVWGMGVEEWKGINLRQMQSKFRLLHLIKNRNGQDNVQIPLLFDTRNKTFIELDREQHLSPIVKNHSVAKF